MGALVAVVTIMVAVVLLGFWLYALTGELLCHDRGLNRINTNISLLVDTARLDSKTLDQVIANLNELKKKVGELEAHNSNLTPDT